MRRLLGALKRSLDPLSGESLQVYTEFDAWYRQAKVPQIRYVALLTGALYVLYAVLEWQLGGDRRGVRLAAHGVLLPGMLLTVALLSYRPKLYRRMIGLLATASVCAVTLNLLINSGPGNDFTAFAPELYLCLMWTFAISGLTLRQAMLTASTSTLILLLAMVVSWPGGEPSLHLLWILASISFGMLSAFLLERAHKTMFLQQSRLALDASTDALTNLWNHARIEQLLAEECARAERYGTPFSVILLDIDHFKQVNDTYGHAVGDGVLREFSGVLRNHVRGTDKVGRHGGEEFLIVLPETTAEQAEAAALLLQQRINSFVFPTIGHGTASFGVTQYVQGESLHAVLDRADQAMYKAKANGRNRIERL